MKLNQNEKFTGVIFDPDPVQEIDALRISNLRKELKKLDAVHKKIIKNFKPKIILRKPSDSTTNA